MGRIAFLFLVLLLSGCASTPLDYYLESGPLLPGRAEVSGVPFIAQKKNHCGPAAVAMVMNWAGKKVAPDDLAGKMITPEKRGTFQTEILGVARREGFLALRIQSFDRLFKEIAAGHPVIVFENLGLSWLPFWHYAVVLGYDLNQKDFYLHSAGDEHESVSFRRFATDWAGGGYWGTVMLPPSQLSATGDEIEHLEAAAGIERVGTLKSAAIAYQTILQRWPRSLGALVGLGNVRYAEHDLPNAEAVFREAAHYHKNKAAVWHNLAQIYAEGGKNSLAKSAAEKAISLASAAELESYRRNLSKLLSPSLHP